MELTMAELMNGKATIIKNKDYLQTSDYCQPFIEKMKDYTDDFRIKVKMPDQITVGQSQDITYNRVLIEAVLPKESSVDGHDEVIGFLYGLDVRKPISKIYRGYLNGACTNLTVFDSKWMVVNEIRPGELINIDPKKMLELNSGFDTQLKKLKTETVDRGKLYNHLGEWVHKSLTEHYYNGQQNVKISPNVPVEAYKSLYIDVDSQYFIPKHKEATMFEVYNAFTQIITNDDKDIMNKFEKTMMVNKLLSI